MRREWWRRVASKTVLAFRGHGVEKPTKICWMECARHKQVNMAEQQPIANDPNAFLSAYVALEPSRDALMQLAGTVAVNIQEQPDPTVAALYLAAGERACDTITPVWLFLH